MTIASIWIECGHSPLQCQPQQDSRDSRNLIVLQPYNLTVMHLQTHILSIRPCYHTCIANTHRKHTSFCRAHAQSNSLALGMLYSYTSKQLYVWLLCKLSFHAQCSMSIYQQDWLTLVFLFVNCGGFLFTSGWSVYQRLHPSVLNSKLVAMAQNGPFTADFSTILCATLMEVFSLSPLF